MHEINTDVLEIKNSILSEAKSAPTLLNDLASMETYISESYQGRSLIELLQNADDCGSTKFYIKRLNNNLFLVANNGREFNKDDLISICRSGSSTKMRRAGTIGFRGIGFKSVVNYANEVYLYSGNYYLIFSKLLTKNELGMDIKVPLIRVPHIDKTEKYISLFNDLKKNNFTTMFVFETKNETIINEIEQFNNNCLLFLKNINNIVFEYGKNKIINISREKNNIFKLQEGKDISEWLVINGKEKLTDVSIAFNIDMLSLKAVPLSGSFIHSFMPTAEKINMPFIINGDFSTDPSRTKIIEDEETNKTITSVVKLLTEIIKGIIVSGYDEFELINVISHYRKDDYAFLNPNSIKNKIFMEYIKSLNNEIASINNLEKIKVQPEWIDERDFTEFCNFFDYYSIYTKGDKSIKGIQDLLKEIKEINFDVEEFLKFLSEYKANMNTRINTIITLTNKYRFSFNDHIKGLILKAYLFDYENQLYRTADILNKNIYHDTFYQKIENKVNDTNDLKMLLKKIGFINSTENSNTNFKFNSIYLSSSTKDNSNEVINGNLEKNTNNVLDSVLLKENQKKEQKGLEHLLSDRTSDNTEAPILEFNKTNNPKKWRSVEKNVQQVLESFDDVKYVQDVSGNNLGYDLIVEYLNGNKKYVEIKSVNRLGDMFSMTQNEYATANNNEYKNQYALAIVEQNEEEMKLIIIDGENFDKIKFIKRIVKYEWVTDSDYRGKYFTFPLEK